VRIWFFAVEQQRSAKGSKNQSFAAPGAINQRVMAHGSRIFFFLRFLRLRPSNFHARFAPERRKSDSPHVVSYRVKWIFRDFKFELPSTPVKRFVVTRDLVDHPVTDLQTLLAEHEREEKAVARQLVHDFAQRFRAAHGLEIEFTGAAAERLVEEALRQGISVRDHCAA
jgi:hypothetical protein